jgi:NifU-like protein involved in Fe-S cluster formation
MSEQLYNTHILRLAANIPHQARLELPQVSLQKQSPICGSRVIVDVVMEDGKVAAFGQEVRACALGQASASILGAHVIGCTAEDLAHIAMLLKAFLQNEGPTPQGVFAELDIFAPAIPHRARHASILLPFEAAAEAAAARPRGPLK